MSTLEENAIDEIVQVNVETADRQRHRALRGQHSKHHGCVKAKFEVLANIPADLRHGIFGSAQRFDALIRFSNGREQDDRRGDAHGMAIKLVGVQGSKLSKDPAQASVQDFVLVDSEVFFTRDLEEYRHFNSGILRAKGHRLRLAWFLLKLILFHRQLFLRLRAFAKNKISSPVETSYFSSVPYALGDRAVKYVAIPRNVALNQRAIDSPDRLSESLVQQLAQNYIVFDFGVDVQTDPSLQPVEDPTIKWSESAGARREWLATITIPQQSVDPKSGLAENIAFSPWHALEAHRPLGAINRARKPVYMEMAKLRHELNEVSPSELAQQIEASSKSDLASA